MSARSDDFRATVISCVFCCPYRLPIIGTAAMQKPMLRSWASISNEFTNPAAASSEAEC